MKKESTFGTRCSGKKGNTWWRKIYCMLKLPNSSRTFNKDTINMNLGLPLSYPSPYNVCCILSWFMERSLSCPGNFPAFPDYESCAEWDCCLARPGVLRQWAAAPRSWQHNNTTTLGYKHNNKAAAQHHHGQQEQGLPRPDGECGGAVTLLWSAAPISALQFWEMIFLNHVCCCGIGTMQYDHQARCYKAN